jgi:hypothetical protein
MGLPQRTRWVVLRLLLPWFFARCSLLLTPRNRAALWSGSGWREAARPREARFYLAHRSVYPRHPQPRLLAAKRYSFRMIISITRQRILRSMTAQPRLLQYDRLQNVFRYSLNSRLFLPHLALSAIAPEFLGFLCLPRSLHFSPRCTHRKKID